MPVYRVTVVQRTTQAVSYRFRSGWTKVDFRGTELAPGSKGEAEVNSRNGYIQVKAKVDKLPPASKFGPEYMAYVLWAITPEGRANNLGEFRLDGNDANLDVTTDLQAFGLIVTAEPYFAVTVPSDVVVMENVIRNDTVGKIQPVNAKFELLQRGQYTLNVDRNKLTQITVSDKIAPEVYQAQNAVRIARWTGADKYASDTFTDAERLLRQAEQYQARKERKPSQMTAREAAQKAEDARIIAIRRQDEEKLAQERQAAADREAAAKAEADAQTQRRLQAEEDRAKSERERLAAERARAEALQAADLAAKERAAANQARAEAEAARQAALAQQQAAQAAASQAQSDAERARLQAADADRLRQKAEQDREEVRRQLMQQLNMVLETRESARGLIVNMSDVLFDTARYTLKPGTREKLSKIAGIVLAHPGLVLEVEGHTDSVGGEAYNQKLSEQRAAAVRDYLIQQGLNATAISSKGFGKNNPIASNDTAAGRQQNRRVELVVSGDVIGTKIQSLRINTQPTATPQQ